MEGERYDWVMVQVDEIGALVRRITAAILDREQDQLVELDRETDVLLDEGFDHSRIALVDARTAALILRPPGRIRGYARLLAEKSRLLHELGRDEPSRGLARRALELQLEAAELETDPDQIDREAIESLLDRDPPLRLGQRHQDLLARLA